MDLYSQCLTIGATALLMFMACFWPLRHKFRAVRPAWLRRGFAGWALGPYFDIAAVYNSSIYSTGASRFAIYSMRLLLPISGAAILLTIPGGVIQ